jgi:cell division protein FtsL
MPAVRFLLILTLLTTFLGCSTDDREIEKANQTISKLQAEVRELQIQNTKLQRHEEMRIGEIAFSQGCRFLVNTCFGRDQIGAGLVQEGLSAHGSWQFLAWMAFKLVFLPLVFLLLIGAAQMIMNTWIFPSAQKRQKALEVIQEAAAVRQKIAQQKAASLAEVQTMRAELSNRKAKLAARRQRLWNYVQFKKSEVKDLKELITELQQQVEILELAKAAAQAFSGRKR